MAIQLTKRSNDGEIKEYFTTVLNLAKNNNEFPVNLDDVWPLVFGRKQEAVRALKNGKYFFEGIDYQPLRKNAQRSENGQFSGEDKVTYLLSLPCLEFFIARKVRAVFEVYRKVFHQSVAEKTAQTEGGYRKDKDLVATRDPRLFTLLTYQSCVDEFGEPVVNARDYYKYLGKRNDPRHFRVWFKTRVRGKGLVNGIDYVPVDGERTRKDYALSLYGLSRVMSYDEASCVTGDKQSRERLKRLSDLMDTCSGRYFPMYDDTRLPGSLTDEELDRESAEEAKNRYTISQWIQDVRSCIMGERARLMRVPSFARCVKEGDNCPDVFVPTPEPVRTYVVRPDTCQALTGGKATMETTVKALSIINDHVVRRFKKAMETEADPSGRASIGEVRSLYETSFANFRTSLCNLVYIEAALKADYPWAYADGHEPGAPDYPGDGGRAGTLSDGKEVQP